MQIPHAILEQEHAIGQFDEIVYTLIALKRDVFKAGIACEEHELDYPLLFSRCISEETARKAFRKHDYQLIFSNENGKVYEKAGTNFREYYQNHYNKRRRKIKSQ